MAVRQLGIDMKIKLRLHKSFPRPEASSNLLNLSIAWNLYIVARTEVDWALGSSPTPPEHVPCKNQFKARLLISLGNNRPRFSKYLRK